MSSKKGSQWEREYAKKLSLWYSGGKNPNLMWRTAGSGGWSSVQAKKGNSTANQGGDLAPIDPRIEPFTNLVSLELKRGYGVDLLDVLDIPPKNKTKLMEGFFKQAAREAEEAGKPFWWLLYKKDRRLPLIFMPIEFLHKYTDILGNFEPNCIKTRYNGSVIVTMALDAFLEWLDPRVFGDYTEEEEK